MTCADQRAHLLGRTQVGHAGPLSLRRRYHPPQLCFFLARTHVANLPFVFVTTPDPPTEPAEEELALLPAPAPVGTFTSLTSFAVHQRTYDMTLSFRPRGKIRAACSAVGGPGGTTGLATRPILENVRGDTSVCEARAPVARNADSHLVPCNTDRTLRKIISSHSSFDGFVEFCDTRFCHAFRRTCLRTANTCVSHGCNKNVNEAGT